LPASCPRAGEASPFGLFYLGHGTGWLVGSVTAGLLYERSRIALIAFSVLVYSSPRCDIVLAERRVR